MGDNLQRFKFFILDILQTVAIAAALFIISWQFLLQPHKVDGRSMQPNFCDKDMVLTDKFSYYLRTPERYEVIIFQSPTHRSRDLIKRIVGMPGETISLENNHFIINGKLVEEVYIPKDFLTEGKAWLNEGESKVIPEDNYFVAGDNREHSEDSRAFGPIKTKLIIGRVWLKYWPLNAVGIIKKGNEQTSPRQITCP